MAKQLNLYIAPCVFIQQTQIQHVHLTLRRFGSFSLCTYDLQRVFRLLLGLPPSSQKSQCFLPLLGQFKLCPISHSSLILVLALLGHFHLHNIHHPSPNSPLPRPPTSLNSWTSLSLPSPPMHSLLYLCPL